jgi:hypothetical protein
MANKEVIEVHALWWAGNSDPTPLILHANCTVTGGGFAGIVTIRKYDHVANILRKN